MGNEFNLILRNQNYHDKLYLFLQNIFRVLPEDKFFNLIKHNTELLATDKDIYNQISRDISSIKPFLVDFRYGLPALFKQKKVIANQTKQLVGDLIVDSYLEIGTVGRYIPYLTKVLNFGKQLYVANDKPATYSMLDIIDRGGVSIKFNHVDLNNYAPLNISSNSLDMVSCYIGLHHIPLDRLNSFIASIYQVLKPGGKFILRDHNCDSNDMIVFVSLIHTVFNIGSGVTEEQNANEPRYFRSLAEWIDILANNGFNYTGKKLFQDNDPSKNALMLFLKE